VKKSLKLKSLTLLLLLAVSIFPFQVFCHTSDSEVFKTHSFNKESSHHDCPLCSFHFCNEFEKSQFGFISASEISLKSVVLNFNTPIVSFSNSFKNKGPPIQFL